METTHTEPYQGDDLDGVLRGIREELRAANEAGDTGKAAHLEQRVRETRQGSRFAEAGAEQGLVEHLAAGGALRVAEPVNKGQRAGHGALPPS
jgi:hypothetical protein